MPKASVEASQSGDIIVANEDDVLDGSLTAAIMALAAPEDYVDVVRRALASSVASEGPLSAFSRKVELSRAWAAPARGLAMYGPGDSGADVFACIASIAAATGRKGAAGKSSYVKAVVDDIASALALGVDVKSLALDWSTERVASEELALARARGADLKKALRRALLLAERFVVGPGDVGRALASSKVRVVVLHPSGYFTAGSPPGVAVVALHGGGVLVAKRDDGGRVFSEHELPKGLRRIAASS